MASTSGTKRKGDGTDTGSSPPKKSKPAATISKIRSATEAEQEEKRSLLQETKELSEDKLARDGFESQKQEEQGEVRAANEEGTTEETLSKKRSSDDSCSDTGPGCSTSKKIRTDTISRESTPPISFLPPDKISYEVVEEDAQIEPALTKLSEQIKASPLFAVDNEGDNVGRHGELVILSVATEHHTYLFNIKKLGTGVFDKGLRDLLEDSTLQKLMIDCREVSDCLWHQFKVKLANVLDLEPLVTIRQSRRFLLRCTDPEANEKRREQEWINNLTIGSRVKKGHGVWLEQPLQEALLENCAAEVKGFFKLYQAIKSTLHDDNYKKEIQVMSQIYLEDFRNLNKRWPTEVIVEEDGQIEPALAKLRERSVASPLLAVDCEGDQLSRKGVLSILSIAAEHQIYLFDIKKLGAGVFDKGLRDLLEDPAREKLMFDCRQDSDCLWHQYKVKLMNVLDLQLLQVIIRGDASHHSLFQRERSGRVQDVPRVLGLLKCLKEYVKDETLVKAKEDVTYHGSIWLKRPLDKTLVKYAASDVAGMFDLYEELKKGTEQSDAMAQLRGVSQKYLDFYRSKEDRLYDRFECNPFLPWRIFQRPGYSYREDTKCMGCKRRFPRSDFSYFQVRNGIQKCPVCKKVKH